MPTTGLFYLSASSPEASPGQDIVHRLSTIYEAIPLLSWSLSHRLFRETRAVRLGQPNSPVRETSKTPSYRYLQILSLSYKASPAYVAITSASAPSQTRPGTPTPNASVHDSSGEDAATIISMPPGAQGEEFVQLMLSKFGPLWQQRQVLNVNNGAAFETGEFRVRVGELRQGPGGGTQMVRGAICEVELINGDGDDVSIDGEPGAASALVKGFWESLGIQGAREVLDVPGSAEGEVNIRQWCEILRLRV